MKIGLVLEGGSRKTIFSAGVLDAFLEEKIEFPYIAGVSAGAHGAINFISKQTGRLKYILTPSKLRDGKRAHAILDGIQKESHIMHYESAYGAFPLDFKSVFTSDVEFEIGMTCAETGKVEFHTEKKDELRLLDLLNATCALPILFPLANFDGKHYGDGCITDSIPYGRAFEKGCDKVVVISTKVPGDKATNFKKHKLLLHPMYEKKFPLLYDALMVRYDNYQKQFAQMEAMQEDGKILVLKPEIELCKLFETRPYKLEESYNHGYEYAKRRMSEIKKFIGL